MCKISETNLSVELYMDTVIPDFLFEEATPYSIAKHLESEATEIRDELLRIFTEKDESEGAKLALTDEIGDALFCLCALMIKTGIKPSEVIQRNWVKLEGRLLNGKT